LQPRAVARLLATIPAVTPRRVDPSTEPATLEAMDVVMQHAYGVASFRSSIDRFVAAQPDGLAVVEEGGAVVGTGCCVAYSSGGFGWIGLVATEPAHERRGIATVITEHLADVLAGHGCASVLDASLKGGPVYERMGFADHGLTAVMSTGDTGIICPAGVESCASLSSSDAGDIVAYDADRFGATRQALLAKLFEQHPHRTLLLRRRGRVAGYLVAQEGTLAPVIADDDDALAALIGAVADWEWPMPPRINLPPESRHRDALAALGFEHRRDLRHMHRGIGALPGRRDCIAGMVSLGEG
jgi:hypothetical protein